MSREEVGGIPSIEVGGLPSIPALPEATLRDLLKELRKINDKLDCLQDIYDRLDTLIDVTR